MELHRVQSFFVLSNMQNLCAKIDVVTLPKGNWQLRLLVFLLKKATGSLFLKCLLAGVQKLCSRRMFYKMNSRILNIEEGMIICQCY